MSNHDLHVKYRPENLDEVLGQDHVVNSLRALFKEGKHPHAYLFTGSSGTGKTTLARIVAKEMGCDEGNITEIDAASHNGVDDARELIASLQYATFGNNPNKFIIVDEAHAISKAAFQVYLKTIEEPPEHVYFVFCTTESDKVPETIKTRCHVYNLKDVSYDNLFELVSIISELEEIVIDKESKALKLIAQAAMGSPRKALTMLSKCRGASSLEDVRLILEEPDEDGEVIELCRLLCGRTKVEWKHIQRTLKRLEGQNPESIRLIVLAYVSKVLMNAKTDEESIKLLAILEAFSNYYNPSEKIAPLLLSLGSLVFQGE